MHWVGNNKAHRPAIIYEVHSEESVSLNVFTPGGVQVRNAVLQADPDKDEPGTWHWPEMV